MRGMRVTNGTSWPGKRPGVRHWTSVSYGPHIWELGVGGLILFVPWAVLMLAALSLWIGLEALVIIASGVLIGLNAARHVPLAWEHARWQRLRFGLWSLLVPEKA